jgi:MFS family permease
MYLFLLSQGLDFTQIAILEATYNVATVVGEIPTGYVGDRVGRRNSLVVGTVVISLTLVGIGLVESFPAFVALYAVWSMGYNFRSGSEDAWLYDTLRADLSADDFARVRGRGESVALAVGVGAAVTGGALGSVDLSYPFYLAAGVTVLGAVVLLTMPEPEVGERAGSDAPGFRETLAIVRETLSSPDLRSFVLYYYVLFSAVTYLVFVFLQPVFERVVVDLGAAPGDVEFLLGLFYGAYSLVGAGLSYCTGAIEERVGLRLWFLALPVGLGGALVGMYFLPLLALPTLLFVRGVADTTRSLASSYVNDRIDSVGRATVLSATAMVSGLTVVPFQVGSGVVSDAVSPLFALAVAGGVLVVVSVAIHALSPPVRGR